jgi:hypothetical protein
MMLDRVLHEVIPYRMLAVSTLSLATNLQGASDKPQAMAIYVDGKLRIEGNLFAFTNPAIEAGLVHCRALLEFLGLTTNPAGRIVNVKKRRPTDIGIEIFQTPAALSPWLAPMPRSVVMMEVKRRLRRRCQPSFRSRTKALPT